MKTPNTLSICRRKCLKFVVIFGLPIPHNSDILFPIWMTSHSNVNSFAHLWVYKKFVGFLHGNQITLSWLVQLKTIEFWPREMLPALAGGDQPGLGVDWDRKMRGGLWLRDLWMTAGSATDLVGTWQLLCFLRRLPEPSTTTVQLLLVWPIAGSVLAAWLVSTGFSL